MNNIPATRMRVSDRDMANHAARIRAYPGMYRIHEGVRQQKRGSQWVDVPWSEPVELAAQRPTRSARVGSKRRRQRGLKSRKRPRRQP